MGKVFFGLILTFAIIPQISHGISQGAITAATGYAGIAVNESSEGGLLNPATVAQADGYHLRLSGGQAPTSNTATNGYLIHVTDNSRDVVIPASLIYQEFHFDQYWPHRDVQLNLGFSPSRMKHFALGIALGYRTRPFESVLADSDRYEFYGRLGLNYFFFNHWSIGLVMSQGDQFPMVGTSIILQRLIRFRLDWKQTNHLNGGMEVYLGRWFVLRLGYLNFLSNGSGTTWGLGFVGPRVSLQYAWAPIMVQSRLDYAHWIDLNLKLW